MNKLPLFILLGVFFVGALWLVWPSGEGGEERRARGQVPVTAWEVRPDRFADVIEAVGTTRANESVVITAQVTEIIEQVNFEDGDAVTTGDVLVELSFDEEQARLGEEKANLVEAERELKRSAELVRQGNAPQARLDTARAGVEATKSRIAAIEAQIADRVIRAPFDGQLGLRMVSPGTLLSPDTMITTLDDLSRIKLDFSVPERFLGTLVAGQAIEARAAAFRDESFTGIVGTIDSRVDPDTRAVSVRAILPNEDGRLRPGMLMTVRLESAPRTGLIIPENSLIPVRDRKFVVLIDDENVVIRTEVSIGTRRPGYVEVRDGLQAGDRIVQEGVHRVFDGITVNVLETDQPVRMPASIETEGGEG